MAEDKRRMSRSSSVTSDSSTEELHTSKQNLPSSSPDGSSAVFLHGYLRIQIIGAQKLRNMDCLRGCRTASTIRCLPSCIANDVSDPYVTVHALCSNGGTPRLVKTSTKWNNLKPDWKEEYVVPIAHDMEGLEFRVKDIDFNLSTELLGTTVLPVQELVRIAEIDGCKQQLRTGVHKVVYLDGTPRHGAFEYFVEYIPNYLWFKKHSDVKVPGVYFGERDGNAVKLYVNAEDNNESPTVKYGKDNENVWEPPRLWKDIFDSFCQAKKLIYVVGWSVDHTQSLLRGEEKEQAIKNGNYSPFIGELLRQKAEEGVTVNVLVWDDRTSNGLRQQGVMGTRDEALRNFVRDTKINLCLAPIIGGDNNHFVEKLRNSIMFTHHQKAVICDEGDNSTLVGYAGGIDLTYGRWDNRDYSLFRTLTSQHQGDFHNACTSLQSGSKVGPRQPWHDIHMCVRGPAVLDLLQNFEERWKRQAPKRTNKLVDLKQYGITAPPVVEKDDDSAWSTQLFRSIDARTAVFDKDMIDNFSVQSFDNIKGVTFDNEGKKTDSSKRNRIKRKAVGVRAEYERRFQSDTAESFEFSRTLNQKRGRNVDSSAHAAMVHHIRRAEHFIYIEGQYFLSSCHLWPKSNATKCVNLVAAEITAKICQKIRERKRFAVYIVIPEWPEGLPESDAVQEILGWQSYTMRGMYQRIADALKEKKDEADFADAKPTDFLNFYCLGNRETDENSEATAKPTPGTKEELISQTRRHQIYVHSKMMIVDDAIALIGSANINQRSLDGTRDSELLLGAWQPAFLASKESVAKGDVHGFRVHCWSHLTGTMEDIFRDPSNPDCVRCINRIAEKNWELYSSDKAVEMSSYLMTYPITVNQDGRVQAKTANGCFPDTDAKILGSDTFLPNFLTT